MNVKIKVSFLLLFLLVTSLSFAQALKRLTPSEFEKTLNEEGNPQLVDVRTKEEYNEGHLKDALNIDYNSSDFDKLISSLDPNKPVFVYCLSGGRSSAAVKDLSTKGFTRVYELEGGIRKWKQAGKTIEENKKSAVQLSKKDFDKIIKEEKFVLADFGAQWCGPCRKMEPAIGRISDDKELKIKVLKIDVDANEKLSQELGISVLPTLHLYKNNKLVWQGEGYLSETDLRNIIKKNMN